MRRKTESGQALILVVVALGLFLIAAIGLAIDGSQLYAQRQMAQNAADAAAQAAIMSMFNRTNNVGANPFDGVAPFDCGAQPGTTPCVYANQNGFSGASVAMTFLSSVPGGGITGSPDFTCTAGVSPCPFAQARVTRTVNTTLLRFLGSPATTVSALAIAGVMQVTSPVPILVLHRSLAGSFSLSGNPNIRICGGPQRSIQVNSASPDAISRNGSNALVDLRKAGPADDGHCSTGTGGDFGSFGQFNATSYPNPASPPPFLTTPLGSTEHYLQPASPIGDPLQYVPAPTQPANSGAMGTKTALANGVNGCPSAPAKSCNLYHPGYWPGGIDVKNETGVFAPGVYYIYGGGFQNDANGLMVMSQGLADDAVTGQGMLVYNTGATSGGNKVAPISVGSNSNATLVGTPDASIYKGILFFQDRSTGLQLDHSFGGGGNTTLTGTVYLHNLNPGAVYQGLSLQGSSGSSTLIIGEIIVDTLAMGGTPNIEMDLDPNTLLPVNQVALVH